MRSRHRTLLLTGRTGADARDRLSCYPQHVMDHIFGSIMGTVAGAMAIVLVPFAAGIAFIIITFLKRRKARTRTTAQ